MSPWRVLDIARAAPGWPASPNPNDYATLRVICDVREVANAHESGSRGVALERAIFARRKADARDDEKRANYEGLPAAAKLELSTLAAHVTARIPARVVRGKQATAVELDDSRWDDDS